MPRVPIVIAVEGGQKYRALSKQLKELGDEGKGLQADLRKAVRDAGRPVVRDVKSAITTLPIKGSRGGGTKARAEFAAARARTERGRANLRKRSGLRRTIASAVQVKQRTTGIRIEVNGRRLPPDQRTLPMALESRRGWRHPVFGDRENWVTQKGGPWFFVSIIKHAPTFRAAIEKVMADVRQRLRG